MINISCFESKIITEGKKTEIDKKNERIIKPKTLPEFKKYLLSIYNADDPRHLTIYSIDSEGNANQVYDEEDYLDEDNTAFKVIYDESILNNSNSELEKKDDNISEDNNVDNIINSFDNTIDDNELITIIDEELKEKEKEKDIFDNKNFSQNLLNKFLNSQNDIINKSKLNLDENVQNLMGEKSKIFLDIINISQIGNIINKSQKIIELSKIKKNNDSNMKKSENNFINKNEIFENNKSFNNHNSIEQEKPQENNEDDNGIDLEFLEKNINLERTVKRAKYITLKNIGFKNVGKQIFKGGELYFLKGEDSSEEYFFAGNKKETKQYISIPGELGYLNVYKDTDIILSIDEEEPLIGKKYIFDVYIKSDEKKVKMDKPLRITINIIEDKEEEEEEQKKLMKEKLKQFELESKEKKEKEEKEEKERIEKEEKERIEKEEEEKEEEEKEKNDKIDKLQELYDKLEEEYYISNFQTEEEVKAKIKELNFNEEQIISWIESIM